MREMEGQLEGRMVSAGMEQIGRALHDLCQPLTTLQCRLEIAGMTGTNEAYREAVDLGLAECVRLMESVDSMREIVRAIRASEALQAAMRRSA
jgi:hypothetical protein